MTDILWKDARLWLIVFGAIGWTLFLILFAQYRQEKQSRVGREQVSAPVSMEAVEETGGETIEPGLTALSRECRFFTVSELNLKRLQMILEDAGLRLDYPRSLRRLETRALNLAGLTLAEIIIGLVHPHGHGMALQNETVEIIPVKTQGESDETGAMAQDGPAPRASAFHIRLETEMASGAPIHFWLESNPLIRLSLTIHPLHGENEEDRVLLQFAAYRNQRLWFQGNTETVIGRAARIDIKAAEAVWCEIAPTEIKDGVAKVAITFHQQGALEATPQ